MGTHNPDALSRMIRLQTRELDIWQWSPPDEALSVLHRDVAERLTAARTTPPSAVYVEASGHP